MTNSPQQPKAAGWPMWPFSLEALPNPFAPAAPDELNQPINPGWSFGNVISVTEQNSSAPDTERDIVSVESYGRQLGQIIDALAVLIEERSKSAPRPAALTELMKLHKHIEEIKSKAAARRLDRIASDVATLKQSDPDEYRRVAKALRDVLNDQR